MAPEAAIPAVSPAAATEAAPTAIRVEGLRKSFEKQTRRSYTTLKSLLVEWFRGGRNRERSFLKVLDGIDLDVPAGTTLGLIGRNGSGKSTLLKIIAGILRPDEGVVEVRGNISPLIELGAGFHPEFSGRENIFLNGLVLGMTRSNVQARFDDIVDFAGLEDFIDDPVRTYSSGMYMRLAFSVAIHADPDVLLLDEILAVGDEEFMAKCHERIEAFQKADKTIVMVSHNLSSIERWCHEVVWLDGGRVALRGAPANVVREYHASVESSSARGRAATPVAIIDTRSPGNLAAEIRLLEEPRSMVERGRFRVRFLVEIVNRGDTTWRAQLPTRRGTVQVGGRLFRGAEAVGEIHRALIPRDVYPGERVCVEHKFNVPSPGSYRVELDLVVEEICWFAERGSKPMSIEVEFGAPQ